MAVTGHICVLAHTTVHVCAFKVPIYASIYAAVGTNNNQLGGESINSF